MKKIIRIATRESALALWQAHAVQAMLVNAHPGLVVELVPMTTEGDERLDRALYDIGGKGLFIKALEQSLLRGETDLAVHSMKDVPPVFPEGLCLGAIGERESPWDALVSPKGLRLEELPADAVVGTASLRRHAQIVSARPDIRCRLLRGNVQTRLRKCEEGEYDAIVLAHAGLLRLGLESKITQLFDEKTMLPAIGQGVIGIECLTSNEEVKALLAPLHCEASALVVRAERAMSASLGGGCHAPVAGYGVLKEGNIFLKGAVFDLQGHAVRVDIEGSASDPEALGRLAALKLLEQGAEGLMQSVLHG